MGIFKCQKCGDECPDFDVAHVCSIVGIKAGEMTVIMAGDGVGKSMMGNWGTNPRPTYPRPAPPPMPPAKK